MAAVKEDISDRDLRAKLKENGISCGPITPTTKNLYIRKLNKKLSEGGSPLSSSKVPSRKSLSSKPSPRRSPGRRSVDPAPSPGRKLIGFSSDEDESAKEPAISRPKRLSGRVSASPRASTATASTSIHDEERPVFRRRSYNTSSPKAKLRQDEERTDIDGRVNMDSHGFDQKPRKLPSYTGLRNLFMRKSIEDSKKLANASPPPEMSYDLEVEDEPERNIYQYSWPIWVLIIVLVVCFLLVYNWQFLSAMLWKGVHHDDMLKICGHGSHGNKNKDCQTKEDIVKMLVEKLQYKLGEMSGLAKCGYSTKDKMTKDELKQWIVEHTENYQTFKPDTILINTAEYILQHPGSGMSFLDNNGTLVTNSSQAFKIVQTTLALKPLMCRIREAFSRVFYQLVFLCTDRL